MNSFAAAVQSWHDYYIMVGTASATLVGLLFVGLSLNIEMLRRPESADLRTLAALTFNSFIYVLLVLLPQFEQVIPALGNFVQERMKQLGLAFDPHPRGHPPGLRQRRF